jgi:NADH:ubiquinone oxidoreductase subunit 3 (subunit A)
VYVQHHMVVVGLLVPSWTVSRPAGNSQRKQNQSSINKLSRVETGGAGGIRITYMYAAMFVRCDCSVISLMPWSTAADPVARGDPDPPNAR